jgi:hypothetical protein
MEESWALGIVEAHEVYADLVNAVETDSNFRALLGNRVLLLFSRTASSNERDLLGHRINKRLLVKELTRVQNPWQ